MKEQDDLQEFRTYGLTLLQLMAVLALAGIVATVIIKLWVSF